MVAASAALLAVLFVLARLLLAADGDVARFVVAGSDVTTASVAVPVLPGAGYDGQFSYRLAVDPADLRPTAAGVTLDGPLRLQRMAYPVAAHVVALGAADRVPWALVVVNVVAVALLALLGALVARAAGRSPWAGLLLPGFSGFVMTVARDLTELVTAVLLVAGVLAWQRGRLELAAGAWSVAVLSRETVLVLVGAFVLAELVRCPQVRVVLAGAAPVVTFGVWQLVCRSGTGLVPVLDSSGRNLVRPLSDLVPAAGAWLTGALALDRQSLVDLGQAAVLTTAVVLAGLTLRRTSRAGDEGASAGLYAAWVGAVLLVGSLSTSVWKDPADFRTSAELHALSALLLLQSRRSLVLPGVLAAVSVLLTALLRATSL